MTISSEEKLINLLKSIGTSEIGHSGGSLTDHLLRTYWLLKKLGADENTCLVGGLHSVYGTNFFTAECLDKNKSTVVADTFGEEIDRLVKLFCSLLRPDEIETNTRGLTDNDYQIMQIVEIANLLDQGGIEEEYNPNLLAFYKETFNEGAK